MLAGGPDWTASLWASADGGLTWAEVRRDNPRFEPAQYVSVSAMVEDDGAIVVVGSDVRPRLARGAVWVGRWQE